MNRFNASSGRISASSSDVSSPALPELSLDASLQRLHQQEDISASSLSSAASSRAWLQSHCYSSSGPEPSSPMRSSPPRPQFYSLDRNDAFRFPPLNTVHSATGHTATGLVGHQETQNQESPLLARPRTSRGLIHPKPFLSSSRATSIASLAEVDVEATQELDSQVSFGTPFATGAFQTSLQDLDRLRDDSASSSSSMQGLVREFPAPSPKSAYTTTETSRNRVETRRLHASSPSKAPPMPSAWTLLLVPLEQSQSSPKSLLQDSNQSSILLPLQASFQEQVEQLKFHMVQDMQHQGNEVKNSQLELLLDLSSISALPANTLARLTPQSWTVMFHGYIPGGEAKHGGPLPYLYRKTGLPIAALLRYRLTTSDFTQAGVTASRSNASVVSTLQHTFGQAALQEHSKDDSSPWERRESEMTLLPAHFSRSGPPLTLSTSRSYPGPPRTPIRRSPLPYSPRKSAFPGDTDQQQGLAHTSVKPAALTMSHSFSEGTKLRALSLAAVHPLSPVQAADSSTGRAKRDMTTRPAQEDASDATSLASGEGTRSYASDLPDSRQGQRSSRGSSHKSFPSNTTTLSSRSTKNTSIRSSRIHLDAGVSDSDGDETDDDLGSRFWTQLSSLGEQVFRESKQSGANAGRSRTRERRSVSISSTASDASVFDFSPLGILVPTDGPLDSEIQDEGTLGTKQVPTSPVMQTATMASLSPVPDIQATSILGRRRAYSSMVPLTGWRAGDSDLRTEEGQRSISSGELPRVLLLEPRDGVVSSVQGQEHVDSITPTVANFQDRSRTLSAQPSAGPSFGPAHSGAISHSPAPPKDRENVWDEAMLQLTERLVHSNVKSSFSPQALTALSRYQAKASSRNEPRSSLASEPPSDPVSLGHRSRHILEASSSDSQNSPLPGLFYDSWVERVDGGINGELGRRSSAFQEVDPTRPADAAAEATFSTSKLGANSPGAQESNASSTYTHRNKPLLQALQVTDWPRPQQRSEALAFDARPTLCAFPSFLSGVSRLVNDEMAGGPVNSTEVGRNTAHGDASHVHAGASVASAQSDLMPVFLTRSQATWIPQVSEQSSASGRVSQDTTTLAPSNDIIMDWADLAQRLRSPGSMRLLCLAASSWPIADLGNSTQEAEPGEVKSSRFRPASLDVRCRAAERVLTRTRSFSVVESNIPAIQAEPGQPDSSHGLSAAVDDQQRRGVARKKAELLAPIRILPLSKEESHGNALVTSTLSSGSVVNSRMKRSLSNIFDLPSPIDARLHQQQ